MRTLTNLVHETLSMSRRRLSVFIGLICLCFCVHAQEASETLINHLSSLEVEQRLLLFMDEVDGIYSRVPKLNKEQLRKADKSIQTIDHKWNIYSLAHQEEIAGDEHLMEIVASYQENKQMTTDSIQYRLHLLKSFEMFVKDEQYLLEQDKSYNEMYEASKKYALAKAQAPLLEKLKVKEQLIFSELTKHYESAKAISQEFTVLQPRMAKLEEKYIELTSLSEKIQAEEYKPFIERIKDYLLSFAAVAIILMFLNMIQSKIQAYKQMRKSAEEYKKMLQGGEDEYPSI